jgi:hypothetical protein
MIPYDAYISSTLWRNRHPQWLKRTNNRCQLIPFVRVGTVRGKYHGYAIHHLHKEAYKRQGQELWNRDVVVLCPFAHEFIFHWLLSAGKRRVRYQKNFPNTAQRVMNWWCRLVGVQ